MLLQEPCLPTLKQGRDSQGQGNNFFCINPVQQPWLGGNSSLPFCLRSKEGAGPRAGGSQDRVLPLPYSVAALTVISLFLTWPRGRAGSLFQCRGGSRGDFVTVRDGAMLGLSV